MFNLIDLNSDRGGNTNDRMNTYDPLAKIEIVGPICTSKKAKPPVETAVKELGPLGEYLVKNLDLTQENNKFTRGTVTPDGRLDLCKQNIGPDGAKFVGSVLSKNTHIKHLLMGDDSLGPQGAKEVAQIIRENPNLETIYLGCNYFKEEGSAYLADALKDNTHIKNLWIKRNELGVGGAKNIASMIASNIHLETLDLITNVITSEAMRIIVEEGFLKNPETKIKTLLLDSNPLGPEGYRYLSQIISDKRFNIETLSLEHTEPGDLGCKYLCEAMKENQSIKELSLKSNHLPPSVGVYFGEMLAVNKALETIQFGHSKNYDIVGGLANKLNDDAVKDILNGLKFSTKLNVIDITFNDYTEKSLAYMNDTLSSNKNIFIRFWLPINNETTSIIHKKQFKRCKERPMKKDFMTHVIKPIISEYRVSKEKKEKKDTIKLLNNTNNQIFENEPVTLIF
ncbi:hypothetical protein CYY_003737 [Polysphondylium violaceum]|uniref:Leucine-rich repeat-containing protein n=1 Tax=Polysphondylium violaceum TaxID=133409 RepID=A0A8J4Q6G3_9MYCE|nr:hypothetical protein CYY_003737 [Polysphondylium violaceum]